MPVHLRVVCKFNLVSTHAPHCCFVTQLSRYQARGKDVTKSKKLEYNIIFVHDLWKSLLIPAMKMPATIIINMGDFTTPHTFFAVIELVIQFSNALMQLFVTPVIPNLFTIIITVRLRVPEARV